MKRCQKVSLIQYKCCIETRFSRCSSQEFTCFTVIVGYFNSLNMLTLPLMRQGKSYKGVLVMLLLSRQYFTGHQEFFFPYVRNSLHSCINLSLSTSVILTTKTTCIAFFQASLTEQLQNTRPLHLHMSVCFEERGI